MKEMSIEIKLVKLMIVMQVHLELLDEVKETPLYRHNTKKAINNLAKDLENQLNLFYKHMDNIEGAEEAYSSIKNGIEILLAAAGAGSGDHHRKVSGTAKTEFWYDKIDGAGSDISGYLHLPGTHSAGHRYAHTDLYSEALRNIGWPNRQSDLRP